MTGAAYCFTRFFIEKLMFFFSTTQLSKNKKLRN